jgi:hypothetical protein
MIEKIFLKDSIKVLICVLCLDDMILLLNKLFQLKANQEENALEDNVQEDFETRRK